MPNSVDSTNKGWMPGAERIPVPASNFSVGNYGRRAVCIHVMDGWMAGTKARFQNPTQQVSSHFGIAESGAVAQYVSVGDTAYANGLSWSNARRCWIDPEGISLQSPHPAPDWQLLKPPTNPNWYTISCELEGKPSTPRPAAQLAAVVRVLQFITSQFPTLLASYVVGQTIIGHHNISPVSRAGCPGPFVNLGMLASAANVATPTPPKRYTAPGVPIYQASSLQGSIFGYLTPSEVVTIDARAPLPGYAANAAHIIRADGSAPGFVDERLLSEVK